MPFTSLATEESIKKTSAALKQNNFIPIEVNSKEEALEKIKELIPEGASVMKGASETLQEIGYTDLLKSGNHKWKNLQDAILAETDEAKKTELRKYSVISDFYLGSAHAITETGEIMIASASGSQFPHLAYTSPNIILVVGSQKIVPSISEAFKRIDEHVVPLEDVRMKKALGFGTIHAKTLILHKEAEIMGRKVYVIIVHESLGF